MRKIVSIPVFILFFMLLIVGCTKSDKNTETPNVTPSDTPQQVDGAKYDPPIEMTFAVGRVDADVNFPEGQSPKDNMWTRLVAEHLGIKLDVTLAMKSGDEYTQKLNALIVTNDLPDLLTVPGDGLVQLDQLIDAGLAEDLTDVYDKYASPLVKKLLPQEALEPLKRDGKLYFLPSVQDPAEEGFFTWIRMDWLKKLKLEEPKTFQDVIAIAEAFKAMNPSKNYGFQAGTDKWNMYSLSGLFSAYHAYPDAWIKDADGNLVNGNIQPEMKAALKSLQNLRNNGLISKEWTVSDDGEKSRQDLINGKVGVVFGQWWAPEWPLQLVLDNDPESEWKAFPFMSIDNKPALHLEQAVSITSFYVLKKGFAHPEAAIQMLNLVAEYYYGEDPHADPVNSSLWKLGPANIEPWGKNIQFHKEVAEAFKSGEASKLHPGAQVYYDMIVDYQGGNNEVWGVAAEYGEGGSLGLYDYITDNNLWIKNEFFGAPTPTMSTKLANLDKLYQETLIQIINGADINTFDTFVEQWKKQGGDEMTKEVNDWNKSR